MKIEEILTFLKAKRSGKGWIAHCPAHGDKNPSLSIAMGENGKPLFKCHAGCEYRDIISKLPTQNTQTFKKDHKAGYINRILEECHNLKDRPAHPAHSYLRGRGLNPSKFPDSILVHDDLEYVEHVGDLDNSSKKTVKKKFAAIVTKFGASDSRTTGIQRIYLDPSGKKADVSTPKKSCGRVSGSGIVLMPYHNQVAVTEGMETGLAVQEVTGIPTIAAGSAHGMESIVLKDEVKTVYIFADLDRSNRGTRAAEYLAKRLLELKKKVYVIVPPSNLLEPDAKGIDWLDVLNRKGARFIENAIAVSEEYALTVVPSKNPESIVCMADVQGKAVEYVWPPYIPRAKLVFLDGDPGVSKTFLALAIISGLSKGQIHPDLPKTKPQRSLILTAEDGLDDTIRPRLDKLGADCSMIFALNQSITLDEAGVKQLSELIEKYKPAVIVIDPIVAFMDAKVDMNRANQVRNFTRPLAELCSKFDCTIIAIRHLSKATQAKALYKGLGSIDFVGAARSVISVCENPDNNDERIFFHLKSNLAKRGPALLYQIKDSKVEWMGEVEFSPDHNGNSQRDYAKKFLQEALKHGPRKQAELEDEAKSKSISKPTLNRASADLKIKKWPVDDKNSGTRHWMWSLKSKSESSKDDQGDQHNQDRQLKKVNNSAFEGGEI